MYDKAKAIAKGELQVLVEYLWNLASISRNDALEPEALYARAAEALYYAAALSEYLANRGRGRPPEQFSPNDAFRALKAAREYEAEVLKGERPAARIEKEILRRYNVTRALLRAARKNNLPDVSLPGIPRADK